MKSPGRRGVTAIDKYIGLRLRTRRLMLHMTQTDLAKVIGLTFQQLQKYEKGTNRITASTLQTLAAAMKVPITYFFENAPCEHADRYDSEMAWTQLLATPDGLALFTAFRGIESKSLRRAVVNLVEGMGKERTIISPAE
jgi:transcriptional regulator with XRE-family HTH domain